MTVREIMRRLETDGWYIKAIRGSHIQYAHPTKPGKVTVANHKGDIRPGTLASIEKQAGLKLR